MRLVFALLCITTMAAYGQSDGIAPSLPANVDQNWMAAVQESIRRSEYNVTWQDHPSVAGLAAAYQAPNRAHNLRTYFTPRGVLIVPRQGGERWRIGLRWADAPRPVEPSVTANRVEYRYGAVTAWYVNDERGLEHGFTIDQPIRALADGDELRLRLQWEGEIVVRPSGNGGAEVFTADGQRIARYDGLHVYDAGNRELASRMVSRGGISELRVSTAGATYPIVIDPILSGTAETTLQSNQANAQFGFSVAGAGDVNGDGYGDVIVGAYAYDAGESNEGAAFLFHGSATGVASGNPATANATPDCVKTSRM